jgi:hypothetical protein
LAALNAHNCYRIVDALAFLLMIDDEDWKILCEKKDPLANIL